MVSARKLKLKKRQAKTRIRSHLIFAVKHDPLNAASGVVLTLWSGRRSVNRALSPEWAAALASLLIPGDQECC
jgi:hypothetical protein